MARIPDEEIERLKRDISPEGRAASRCFSTAYGEAERWWGT